MARVHVQFSVNDFPASVVIRPEYITLVQTCSSRRGIIFKQTYYGLEIKSGMHEDTYTMRFKSLDDCLNAYAKITEAINYDLNKGNRLSCSYTHDANNIELQACAK